MKKSTIGLIVVVVVIVAIIAGIKLSVSADKAGNTPISPKSYAPASPEEIYQSIADFYSLLYDRSDVKEGTFELWPKGGEKVVLTATLESFEIEEDTRKELSEHDSVLEIETNYRLCATLSPKTVNVNISFGGEDLEVPVIFNLRVRQKVTEETAEQLKQLLEPGEKVEIRGKIRRIPIYYTSSDINDYILELYGRKLRRSDNYQIDEKSGKIVIPYEATEEKFQEAVEEILDLYLGHRPSIELHQIEGIFLD